MVVYEDTRSKSSGRRGNDDDDDNDDDLNSDAKVIQEASTIQQDTRAAIQRIQQRTTETQELGATTLEELQEQREQLHRIQDEGQRIEGQLKTAEKLQNRLSRWSLNFNRGAARRQAQAITDFEKERDMIKQKRREMSNASSITATGGNSTKSSSNNQQPEVVITPHGGRRRTRGRSRKAENETREDNKGAHKGLLYGTQQNGAMDPELQKLAGEDDEIDRELDKLGDQLDDLFHLATTIGGEANAQSSGLREFTDKMAEVNHQQRVVNNRTGRFLSGRLRRDYEQESITNPTGFW